MSEVGYYRYKVTPTIAGVSTVRLYINGSLASTATIIAREFCNGFRVLKYMDRYGRYRFFPFNQKWQQVDKATLIGKVNNFVTSVLDSQSDARNIGYKNDRSITLTAGSVSDDELDKLADIYTSPRVYLYVGSTDRTQDWILVTVSGDGVGRRKNNKFGKVTIDVKLPEYHAVTKI
jgi:hypothetical protein